MARENTRDRADSKKALQRENLRKPVRRLDAGDIDITDYERLRRFLTEHGKILPARLTGASAKQQRQIRQGVRRARNIGLLP